MRRPFVAANWKMNLDRRSALELAGAVREHVGDATDVDVGLFPPAVYLAEVAASLAGSPVRVGAQNCCDRSSGAYTGETSVSMIRDVGGRGTLIGHSERRHVYGETDEAVNAKLLLALAADLEVILCLGETQAEREAGRTEEVCGRQIRSALVGVDAKDVPRITLAYEPVWAIGTGESATPDQAQAVHAYVRGFFGGLTSDAAANAVRIQYGGSVKPDNARELMAMPDIDGALVGGASLKAETFLPIIDGGRQVQ